MRNTEEEAMQPLRSLDYQELARLLELAASEHRELGANSSDPVASYQFRKSVDFFTAARNAARDYMRHAERQDADRHQSHDPGLSAPARRVNAR
jgi:hypothetical protein